MITSIAFTVYPVRDMARSRRFYEEILGLNVGDAFGDQWVEYDVEDPPSPSRPPTWGIRRAPKGGARSKRLIWMRS